MDKKSSVSVLDLLLRPELPDVRRELPEKNIATPIDAIKAKLTAGEIDELAVEIQMLGGYIVRALEDVKNA